MALQLESVHCISSSTAALHGTVKWLGMCPSGVVVAIETPQGTLVKVPQHVTSEDYSSALSQRDAKAVMAGLLGIVAAHRGVQHAPLAMLASQTKVLFMQQTSHVTVNP